jgi:hypothetical protein
VHVLLCAACVFLLNEKVVATLFFVSLFFTFSVFHFCSSLLFSSLPYTHLSSQENIFLHNAVMGDGNECSDEDHAGSCSNA